MARFVTLNFHRKWAGLAAAGMGSLICFSTLRAEVPAQTPPAKPPPTVATVSTLKPVATKPPVTAAAPVTNAAAAVPPEALDRYGKILMPTDEASHPVKLKLPLVGAGEVKVPTPDELNMREKLEQLAVLSDTEIHAQLQQWPAFSKMSLRDQGMLLVRMQDFRDYRARTAAQKAHDMGLVSLTPEQKARFEKEFWDKRLKMDRDLVKQLGPIFTAREQKLEDELSRDFSPSSGPIALGPKPPVTPPVPVLASTNAAPVPVLAPTNTAAPVKAPAAPAQPVVQGRK